MTGGFKKLRSLRYSKQPLLGAPRGQQAPYPQGTTRAPPAHDERDIQISIVQQLRTILGADYLVMAIPNQRMVRLPSGILRILAAMGAISGAHDVEIARAGRCLLMEVKRSADEALSDKQIEFHAQAARAGMIQCIVWTPEMAALFTRDWIILNRWEPPAALERLAGIGR